LLCLLLAIASGAALGHELPRGAPRMDFVPPAPGSYALQRIQRTPGSASVLDSDGSRRPLARYTTGKVTLLSFVYTYCVDPTGCPLAYETFVSLRERLMRQPEIARRVRFVSLSFDPRNDGPAQMKLYGGRLADPSSALRWHFLTTGSVTELAPLLESFGQDVSVELDDEGRPTRVFNHMLKVFLLDARGVVREIYTTAFLLPDVIFNDIQTLLMEERRG
jgi:cytochrome oxidase Cu insertion factor (SCO1/SenC/PrrC family)